MAQSVRGPEPMKELTEPEWRRFKRDFKIFLVASEKEDASERTKGALLLNYIGSEALTIYECFAVSKRKESLDKLFQYFEQHFVGSVNEIYERFCFRQIVQKEGETF